MTKLRHIEIWFDGGTDEEADALFDSIADVVHDNEPEGVDVHVVANLADDAPDWWSA